MENFECNTIEDLLSNRSFREWALARVTQPDGYWENWLIAHPDKAAIAESAKRILQILYTEFEGPSQEFIELEVRKTLVHIDDDVVMDMDEEPEEIIAVTGTHRRRYWLMAAAVMLAAVAGWALLSRNDGSKVIWSEYPLYSKAGVAMTEQLNKTDTAELVVMADGSHIVLEPGTRISYPGDFNKEKREVFLSGNAFFDVRKDAGRPFFVYTKGLVTKVLGTSFRIKAYTSDVKATVTVLTGKVSVYRMRDAGKKEKGAVRTGTGAIVVTPNQTLVFSKENDQLSKVLIDRPAVIAEQPRGSFNFFRTPVKEIFRLLQESYNIPILYDEETLSGCSLTANIENETFFKKLDLICSAIDASYEVADGQIVITSRGCK